MEHSDRVREHNDRWNAIWERPIWNIPIESSSEDDLEDEDDDSEYEDNDFDYEDTSWNSATLKDVRDGLSGNMYIEELKSPVNMLHPNITVPQAGPIPFRSNRNFYSDGKPGMVLKIRARGRRTDHSIITLIQSILHKRFSYKMGLGGVLLMIGGRVARHIPETFPLVLSERYLDCNPAVSAICTIVNNPVLFLYQEDDLPEFCNINGYVDTNNSYESHCFFGNQHGLFVNDVTPKDTEYVGYFNVAEKVYRV